MEDRSGQILAVAILFIVLCWIAVLLRIYCRAWIIRSLGVDDKLTIVLLAVFTVYLAAQIRGASYGAGRRMRDLTPERQRKALMYMYICELLYIISTCLLKISVGYFLLRVAVQRAHIWIVRLLMIGTALFGTAYLFIVAFQCKPVSTFWDDSPRSAGKCLSAPVILSLTFTASILNCLADWAFGILPVFIVWSLTLPRRTRLLAIGILSFAAVGSTATIVRSCYIPTLLDGDDFLHATTDVAIWSTVEPGIGIIAASAATLRPLWELLCFRLGLVAELPRAADWRDRFADKPRWGRDARRGVGLREGADGRKRLHRKRWRIPSIVPSIVATLVSRFEKEEEDEPPALIIQCPTPPPDADIPAPPAPVLHVQAVRQGMPTHMILSQEAADAISVVGRIEDGETIRSRYPSSIFSMSAVSATESGGIPSHWKRDTLDASLLDSTGFYYTRIVSPTAPKIEWTTPRISTITMGSFGLGSSRRESSHNSLRPGYSSRMSVFRDGFRPKRLTHSSSLHRQRSTHSLHRQRSVASSLSSEDPLPAVPPLPPHLVREHANETESISSGSGRATRSTKSVRSTKSTKSTRSKASKKSARSGHG